MTEQWLSLCIQRDIAEAQQLGGFTIPDEWLIETKFMQHKIDQCRNCPEYIPWCTRAIVLNETMIGRIGFHEPPDSPHLRAHGPNTIEFGYSIFEAHRRQGYATEAVRALMLWATRAAGIEQFVLSIGPGNTASQAIARRLGFTKVGEQIDDVDGLEEVFLSKGGNLFANDSSVQ